MTHTLSFVAMGVEARCRPSKSIAHCRHMKRQPFLHNGCPCHGRHHCHRRCHLRCCHRVRCRCCCRRHRNRPYCRHHCCWPLPLRLPSTIAAAISVASPSAIIVSVALAVGHCPHHHRRPSQLPLPSAITIAMPLTISVSCCLGVARIVFNQLKQ